MDMILDDLESGTKIMTSRCPLRQLYMQMGKQRNRQTEDPWKNTSKIFNSFFFFALPVYTL